MKKRILALLLSATLLLSLTAPAALAGEDEMEDTTIETTVEQTVGEEDTTPPETTESEGESDESDGTEGEQTPSEGEQTGATDPVCPGDDTCTIEGCQNHTTPPTTTVCETCGEDPCTCNICEDCGKDPCVCVKVGDEIWIKSGSLVVKDYTNTETDTHTLVGNYQVKIKNIIKDEDEVPVWYEFEFTSLGIGEAYLALFGYKYVEVEDTSVTEPEEETDRDPWQEELEDGTVISIEGDLPDGTEVEAAVLSEDKYHVTLSEVTDGSDPVFALDITLKDANGNLWQPEKGNYITVSVSVDMADETKIGILHVHNGEASPIGMYGDYKVKDGKLTFKTDGFSEFYGYIVENDYVRDLGKTFCNPAPLISTAEYLTPSVMSVSTFGLRSTTQNAVMQVAETENEDSVVLDKWVEEEGDHFKLLLESYATGTEGTVTEVPVPSDIVLVLDESGSMDDCIECNHEISSAAPEDVTTKGNVIDSSKGNDNVLFTGHKVFGGKESNDYVGGDIWIDQEYTIIYPVDGTTRTVKYCEQCKGWFSSNQGHDAHVNHTCAKWIPFEKSGENPTNNKTDTNWECRVQFYCQCDHDTMRVDALKAALESFLEKLYEDSVGEDGEANTIDDVANRIAIVGYGANARYYSITGERSEDLLKAGRSEYTDGAAQLAQEAFRDIRVSADKAILEKAVNKIEARECTETHSGIKAAELIFQENSISTEEKRNRVMILFTDGAPGSGYYNYGPGYEGDWTNPGIESAYRIKNTYGATVYTVGLFPGADASDPSNLPGYDVNAHGQQNPGFFDNANCVLHLVSSNYLHSTGVEKEKWGEVNPNLNGTSYYLSTENEEGLYTIFDALSSVVEPGKANVALSSSTIVKDVITDQFTIPETTTGQAKVVAWTETFKGFDEFGNRIWEKDTDSVSEVDDLNAPLEVKVEGRTVTVSKFDFAENYVSIDKDLNNNDIPRGKKLMVQIEIVPTVDGGKYVATNTEKAGIYTTEGEVAKFPVPHVDIPTTVTVKKTVKGGPADTFTFNAYGYKSWKKTYDNIQAGTSPNIGTNVSNYLQANGTVIDKNEFSLGSGETKEISDVLVGSTITIKELNAEDYDTEVKVNGNTVEPKNGEYEIQVTAGMEIEFINTYKHTKLTIKKEGCNESLDPNQTFIFTVVGMDDHNKSVNMTVVVCENGSVSITDIPLGNYLVTEKEGWSWRYTVKEVSTGSGEDKEVIIAESNGGYKVAVEAGGETVTFSNDRDETQWLDGNTWCRNIFDGVITGTVDGSAVVNNEKRPKEDEPASGEE